MRPFKNVLLYLAVTLPIHAADIHVPGDYPTIQQAIDAATSGDAVLVAPGTYVENINFKGKAITVSATGDPQHTVIDGGQSVDPKRASVVIFSKGEGPDSVLEGFTLTNGKGMIFTVQTLGGAVFCRDSSPTLRKNIVKENKAVFGAGIYCKNGSPVIEQNVIKANDGLTGSGIYCVQSDIVIEGNEITHHPGTAIHCHDQCTGFVTENQIHHNGGGGILCSLHSSPLILHNTIEHNTSLPASRSSGGIMVDSESSPSITDNIIQFNKAHDRGGAIACYQKSNPSISTNTIHGNEAFIGGGISASETAYPRITYNSITGNRAEQRGGGIDCYKSGLEIHHNTIEDNTALHEGGGICLVGLETLFMNVYANNVVKNTASKGGGMAIMNCRPPAIVTRDNVFSNNIADGPGQSEGAGIYVSSSEVFVSETLIKMNTSRSNGTNASGGGLFCINSDVKMINTLVAGNTSTSAGFARGGGACCIQSSMTMANCTIFENTAPGNGAGGGVYLDGADAQMVNSIAWNNDAVTGSQLEGGSIAVQYSDIQGGWIGDGNIDADPLFVGALDGDLHLRYDSPCRGAGTWDFAVLHIYDFEGDLRLGDGMIDMGADEFHPHLYYLGDAQPGKTIELRVIGWPGTTPVDLWLGTYRLVPPTLTMYGYWYLGPPVVGPVSLAPMPPSGVQSITAEIPVQVPPPYDVPLQALLFDRLSNLCLVEVR